MQGRPPHLVSLNKTVASTLRAKIADGQLHFPLKDFRKRWHPLPIREGINKPGGTREENYHFHDLRTYSASDLIRRNTNPLAVQNLVAHSDMGITNIYAETDSEMMLEAVKRLDCVQESTGVQMRQLASVNSSMPACHNGLYDAGCRSCRDLEP